MKPTPLQTLIEQASPLPYRVVPATGGPAAEVHIHDADTMTVAVMDDNTDDTSALNQRTAELLVHAANLLPKLVEALRRVERDIDRHHDWEGEPATMKLVHAVLAEANNPEAGQ